MFHIHSVRTYLSLLIRSRLSWRIALSVLLSIAIIEAIILIPSYHNYRRDLLKRLEDVGMASIGPLLNARDGAIASSRIWALYIGEKPNMRLRGVAVYDGRGALIGAGGERPTLRLDAGSRSIQRRANGDDSRYEVAWFVNRSARSFAVVARLDASWIHGKMVAFVWRIVGLVLIISSFVAAATMLVLAFNVIVPVLRLRRKLLAAAEDPKHSARYTMTVKRKDELGDVMRAFNTMLEDVAVSHRKEIERVVAMTENSIAANIAYGPALDLVYCNKAGLALCGAGDIETLRRAGYPLVKNGDGDRLVPLAEFLQRGRFSEEVWLQVAPGRLVPCLVSGNQLRDEHDAPRLFFASILDVGEMRLYRERLEAQNVELAAANRAKSEFLANMSHELRTPLNAIIGFSEMIQNQLLGPIEDDRYVEYAGDINDSGTLLLEIISDILDLSKIEAGKLELCEETVDIAHVIETSLRLVGERAKDAGLRLTAEIPADLARLRADRRMIQQILLNLLSNAIKFTAKGGVVTVRAACRSDGGLTLAVADTGIGIAAGDIPKVLEPFGQIDSALTRRHTGTGLGVPLVKSMAALHGGCLEIESTVDSGTMVTIVFPSERTIASVESAPKHRCG